MSDMQAPSGPLKLVILPRTRRDLDRAALRRHLETVHAPMVMAEPEVSGVFVTYVHHYTRDCAIDPVLNDRDAVAMFRFAAIEDMIASKGSAGYRDKVGPDEGNFSETEGTVVMFAQERSVLPGTDAAPQKLFVFHSAGNGEIAARAEALAPIAEFPGVHGIITNTVVPVEGEFDYRGFDEIGIGEDTDLPGLAQALQGIAPHAHAGAGDADHCFLLTDTVRFK